MAEATEDKPKLTISPDDENFTSESIAATVARLQKDFDVTQYYYIRESAAAHAATVIIQVLRPVLVALPANLVSSTLYDALKYLIRRPHGYERTTFVFDLEEAGDKRSIHAVIGTSSDEHLRQALSTLQQIAQNASPDDYYIFKDEDPNWIEA